MRKRWGVQVIAIAMLIFGLIVFLLGVLPLILLAARGAGAGWQALLALPTVIAGCSGALFLLAFGSLLLTLVKISENAGARSWKPEARGTLVRSAGTVERPVVETGAAAVAVVAGAEALATRGQAVETRTSMPEALPAALAAGVAATSAAGHEAPRSQTPGQGLGEAGAVAGPIEKAAPAAFVSDIAKTPQEEVEDLKAQLAALDAQLAELRESPTGSDESLPPLKAEEPSQEAMEASALPVEMAPPWSEEGADEVSGPVEGVQTPSALEAASETAPGVGAVETPPEDVDALRAQLGALEAQLAELGEHPAGPDEPLPPMTEEPPLDARGTPKLPGSHDMARIAAEMASLKPGPADNIAGE